MPRVKKSLVKSKRHKKILKSTKGYRGAKSRLVRSANEALMHAGEYAYSGRKQRKRKKRSLWISQINAAVKASGASYSQFIRGLKKADIRIDRKILSGLSLEDKKTFDRIVSIADKSSKIK